MGCMLHLLHKIDMKSELEVLLKPSSTFPVKDHCRSVGHVFGNSDQHQSHIWWKVWFHRVL